MVSTAEDVLERHSGASSAYTQSEEISLIFPQGTKAFNGRVHKTVSLAAAYTSVRFNYHLNQLYGDDLMMCMPAIRAPPKAVNAVDTL